MPEKADTVVNLDELQEIMDYDMALIQACFADFIQDWPGAYIEIKDAVLDKNGEKLIAAAHKLKGTLRYLAAEEAADAAYALEEAGKKDDMHSLEIKLGILKDACQRLVDYIHDFSR